MKWLFFIPFLLLACTPTICNTPYINFEKSCCLDQNNNSICDFDDNIVQEVNQTIIQEEVVEEKTITLGMNLSQSLNDEDYGVLYSLLTSYYQSKISEEDFILFYQPITFGIYRAYDDRGDLIAEHADKTEFRRNILSSEDESEIVISFYNGSSYEDVSFDVENKKINDFEEVVYGCKDDSYCSLIHEQVCEKTCVKDNKFSHLRENNSLTCKDYQCQCLCEIDSSGAKLIVPDWSLLD